MMITESIVIIAILAITLFFTLRRGGKSYTLLILPSLVIPLSYLIIAIVSTFTKQDYFVGSWPLIIVSAAAVLTALLVVVLSPLIRNKGGKGGYIVGGMLYTIGLLVAYIVNLV